MQKIEIITYRRKLTLLIFLLFWFVSGSAINLNNVRAYNLQQMGVDAIVAHGTFLLGNSSVPILKPMGDTFSTSLGTLAAKQPGQFMLGAIVYAPMRIIGLTYEDNYDRTATLVTWLSASLIASAGLAILFNLLCQQSVSITDSFISVLATGLCSFWLVYAGIAHHDIIAAAFLIFSIYFVEIPKKSLLADRWKYMAAGFFAALTLLTSMLPALVVACFLVYALIKSRNKYIYLLSGVVIGLIPLLLYNDYYFGNAFKQANVAGNYSDTFLKINWLNFSHHFNAYFGDGGISLLWFAPALLIGFLSLPLLKDAKFKLFILVAFFAHVLYICNIETLGTCSWGPRYLLPLLPFSAIGLAHGLKSFSSDSQKKIAITALTVIILYATHVTYVGISTSAMQCDLENFIYIQHLKNGFQLQPENYPLRVLVWPAFFTFILIIHQIWKAKKEAFNKI